MSYLGSKSASGAREIIVAQMPPHDTYIETHLGTGAVFRAKPLAARSVLIDLDPVPLYRFDGVGSTMGGPTQVDLVLDDCVDVLERLDWDAARRVVIYADPPYVIATRTSTKRYHCDYDDADHVRLIRALRAAPAAVILSGYPSALYDELVGDWRTLEFQAMTRGGVRTEKLWMNFEPGAVHWSSFAGRDCTDRQRIKRKAERWRANFRRLPQGERGAILAALMAD